MQFLYGCKKIVTLVQLAQGYAEMHVKTMSKVLNIVVLIETKATSCQVSGVKNLMILSMSLYNTHQT